MYYLSLEERRFGATRETHFLAGMIAVLFAAMCYAQTQPNGASRKTEFEVASVRPILTDGRRPCFIQSTPHDLSRRLSGDRLRLPVSTIASLVMDAYNVREDQLTGLPTWADCSERYELNALVPQGSTTGEQLRLMLQFLLAERFQLKLRRETKKITVYELNTAKSGLKLKLFPDRTAEHRNAWASVPQLIELFLDYPIVDKTGLSGFFDTNYHDTWNVAELREELQQARPVNLSPGMAFHGLAPSIFHEVEAEYGLTLKKVTAPTDFLVIEHVERPSGN
jgi:uncharacterized protein (TIGR03435 family)